MQSPGAFVAFREKAVKLTVQMAYQQMILI